MGFIRFYCQKSWYPSLSSAQLLMVSNPNAAAWWTWKYFVFLDVNPKKCGVMWYHNLWPTRSPSHGKIIIFQSRFQRGVWVCVNHWLSCGYESKSWIQSTFVPGGWLFTQVPAQRRGLHVTMISLETSSDVIASNMFQTLEYVVTSGCCRCTSTSPHYFPVRLLRQDGFLGNIKATTISTF